MSRSLLATASDYLKISAIRRMFGMLRMRRAEVVLLVVFAGLYAVFEGFGISMLLPVLQYVESGPAVVETARELQLPVEREWATNVYWMYGVVLDESTGMDAAEFGRRLAEKGIQARPFFLSMHEQPVFHDMGLFAGEGYPVAERIARQGLYLPSGLALTEEQMAETVAAVRDVLA